MKKISVFIISLLLFFHCGHGQQVNVDSLHQVMKYGSSYKERMKAYLFFLDQFILKNLNAALETGNEALRLARENADSVNVAKIKRFIGEADYFKGRYDGAAGNFYEAITILEKIPPEHSDERKELANTYNDLAKLYRKTKNLDRSLENYDKAMTIFTQLKDSSGILMILNESGVVFEYKEDYDEAVNRYEASLKIAEALHDQVGISYALSFIAGIQTIQKKYDEAEKNLLHALGIRQQLKDSFAMALTWSDLGATYNAKGDYSKAIECLEASNSIAQKMGLPELQSNNLNEMSSVAEKQGRYQDAFEYFKKTTTIRDSLFSIEKTKQIEELNTKYETEKKELIIEQQENHIRSQNFLFIGIAAFVILSVLLAYSQYKRFRLKQEARLKTEVMKQQELATKAVIEAEEEERNRIARDLHDGVGQMMSVAKMNLSAFESEIDFKKEEQKSAFEKIINLVDESCKEVRNVSHNMMPNVLLKKDLATALNDFVDKLDKKNLYIRLHIEGLDERLDSNIESVLYRVVQECVNNVIKHSGATELDISIIRDKDGISATIEDNGKGFNIPENDRSDGIGLKNIITRIDYLRGAVDFDSAPGRGTVVSLHVPLNFPKQ